MKKVILGVTMLIFPFNVFTAQSVTKVGVISDIHAGSLNKRANKDSTVYPKRAVKFFDEALARMNGKVDLVVVLGDIAQSGKSKYYRQLKRVEKKRGIKVLWVKGNHDTGSFRELSEPTYYYDINGTRFIVLNNSENCPKPQKNAGCLDQSQIEFLRLNKTDNTIVLQHVPPLVPKTCEFRMDFISEENITVWAGHFHKRMNCGNISVFPALTEKKQLNYHIVEF